MAEPSLLEALTGRAKRLTREALDRMGYEVRRKGGFARLPECTPADRALLERPQACTMTSLESRWTMLAATRYINDAKIPGAIVECGVWRGGVMMVSALALLAAKDSGALRDIWMYDTFAGMTKPTEHDRSDGAPALAAWAGSEKEGFNDWCYASLEDVTRNVASTGYPMERVRFIKGPCEETLKKPENLPQQIALLRLDTDFYESTAAEMEVLFPRLARNGVLVLDDYGYWSGARKAVDEYLAAHGVRLLLQPIDSSGARMAIKTVA